MSSFQIDLTPSLAPTIGVLLNISPDHLDRHGTMENYAGIKGRLIARAETAVVGTDDDLSWRIGRERDAARGHLIPIAVNTLSVNTPGKSASPRAGTTSSARV